jgi:hypothetical protein
VYDSNQDDITKNYSSLKVPAVIPEYSLKYKFKI